MRAKVEHQHVEPGVVQRNHLPRIAIHAAFLSMTHDDGFGGLSHRFVACRNPPTGERNTITAVKTYCLKWDAVVTRRIFGIGFAATHEPRRTEIQRQQPTAYNSQCPQTS